MSAEALESTLRLARPRPRAEAAVTARHIVKPATQRNTPDFTGTVKSLAIAIVEVLHGVRSPQAIVRWVTPALLEKIREYAQLRRELAKTPPAAGVHSIIHDPRVCFVSDAVLEATAVVRTPQRSRAVALRLERSKTRWLVTDLVTV